MGKFVTRLIVVCNVDGAKSANGKIRYALFVKPSQVNQLVQSLNQYTHGYDHRERSQPRRRNQRKSKEGYLCVVFVCVVWEVHRPTIADNGDPVAVSLSGLHRSATSAYSKEIPGKLLACCVSVWNASARRSRIILKGTWLTAQTVIGELSGLFIGIRAPRGYPDCLKTVPVVSVSNSYQRIFGYSNYPPRLSKHASLWYTMYVKWFCVVNVLHCGYRLHVHVSMLPST